MCAGCLRTSPFYNRCDLRHCPCCAVRLSAKRKESLTWWTRQISQPKHVVLTCRNTDTLTKARVLEFKKNLTRLRRSSFAKAWRGGFYSLEVTNDGESGWHLHAHLLVDARWIDSRALSKIWERITGDSYIVKVIDCRGTDYLREVTKYVVKGNDMARLTGDQIAELIESFDGVKTFGSFGNLYKLRSQHAAWREEQDSKKETCECGCDLWKIMDANEFEWWCCQHGAPPMRPP